MDAISIRYEFFSSQFSLVELLCEHTNAELSLMKLECIRTEQRGNESRASKSMLFAFFFFLFLFSLVCLGILRNGL